MAVVFREGHCSLSGKIMRTIFHSIKLLYLAQLATHTKVKERDLLLHDREEVVHVHERASKKGRHRKRTSLHNLASFKIVSYLLEYECIDVGVSGLYFSSERSGSLFHTSLFK